MEWFTGYDEKCSFSRGLWWGKKVTSKNAAYRIIPGETDLVSQDWKEFQIGDVCFFRRSLCSVDARHGGEFINYAFQLRGKRLRPSNLENFYDFAVIPERLFF